MPDLQPKYRIAICLMNLISKTWRIRIKGKIPDKGVAVFWHGYMLPVWFAFKSKAPVAVVSQSKDGSILSSLLERLGYELIRGSSSKDGKLVLNEICTLVQNKLVLITPDGPRGPERKMKPGAVIAAKRTSSELFLVGVKMGFHIPFNKSWDKFKVPMPFSKIEVLISDPILISDKLSISEVDDIISLCDSKLNNLYR
jgi:lysophospholipid acyltransferase (LPLAT)-like uncharacterized protein